MTAAGRRWRAKGLAGGGAAHLADQLAHPGGYALLENLRSVSGRLALDPQISVFVDAKRADTDALAAALKRDSRISRVRLVPREQALKELGTVPFSKDQMSPEAHAKLFASDLPRVARLVESSGIKQSEAK